MMRSLALISFIYACLCLSAISAQCPWTESDVVSWSAASTWSPLPVPTYGTNVTIKSGLKVVYDVVASNVTFAGITISPGAQLILDGTKDVVLETKYIYVMNGASFRIGSSGCKHTKKASITLFGALDSVTSIAGLGNKVIAIDGSVEWYGNPPQPTWTNIVATVKNGSNTITVKDTLTNWLVGDTIALASTDYYQELTETFTITAISGKTITLNRPATYLHWGADNEFAEVANLRRNVLVQGDISSDTSFFGGHCIVARNGSAKVYGVEFNRMGQKGFIGRYPFHFHVMGDQIGKGHFIKENSFHNGYQRCLTVHGTSGIFVQNNVGFNVTGHCYFLEEGSETYNTYDHNLGMVVNVGTLIPTDSQPSIFWITNPNNTWTNNVAVGGAFGFWFSLPLHPLGLTAYQTWVYPRFTPLIRFDGNLAHSSSRNGIHADDFPKPDGTTELSGWSPLTPPYTTSTQSYNTVPVPAYLNYNNAYKNRNYGIWLKGGYFFVRNSLLIDNGIGINTPGAGNLVYDTTIVGETDNIGTPAFTRYYNDMGRSRPRLWQVNFPIHGWEGYDAAGSQFARNITFVNFTTNSYRRAGAVGALPNGKNVLPPTDILTQSTLINSNAFAMYDVSGNNDGPNHIVFHDADGSLTGAYGNTINTNNSILLIGGGCVKVPAWNDGFYNCSQLPDGYSQISINNQNTSGTVFGASLNSTFRASFIPFGKPTIIDNVTAGDTSNNIRTYYTLNAPSRRGYLLRFFHATPPQLQVNLRYASTGEWVVVALEYPATTFKITRGYSNVPVVQATSLSGLNSTSYFYDSAAQMLYVMYFEDNGNLQAPSGFPLYGYGSSYLNIVAGCGNACNVNANNPVPAAWADTEDKYKAKLRGCASSASAKEGTAYFSYNKNTHFLTYTIYHNIPAATTGGIYSNGVLIHNLPVAQAPIRGALPLSWNKHNSLWNGNFTVIVKSAQFPNGEIIGKIGCVGTACSAPPKISAWPTCSLVKGEAIAYSETLNTTFGWADWSWGSNRTYNYTVDKLCGNYAAKVDYNSYGSISLHVGTGNCIPSNCTQPSWMKTWLYSGNYSHFQFYVRSPSGPLPIPMQIQVHDNNNVQLGVFTVPWSLIDNWVIEETWTRVRVPFSLLGIKGTEWLGRFTIALNGNLPTGHTLLIDDIKLVPTYTDPITRSPAGAVKAYADVC